MPLRKRLPPKNAATKGRERKCFWTQVMGDVLADAYLYQYCQGNRVSGTFISNALDEIEVGLKEKFLGKRIDKEKFKNRKKLIKNKQNCNVLVEDGNMDSIDDFDNMISHNEISLEIDCAMKNDDDDQHKGKNKVGLNENELEFIRDNFDIVVEAILKSTSELIKVV
ncbi:unnamed protein product [Dovyalis caffra]|uniref:Uncharacterized protein n=1 Tax=Dovyalis caffra TaxID=77055 RepID=A0AAV1RMV7_9ROSI|nr:unnamed protein product [Dovyalis caffra]